MTKSNEAEAIIAAYTKDLDLYRAFESSMRNLVENVLGDAGVAVHSVTSRTKENDSLSKKVSKNPSKYGAISEITDVVGLRVIVHFSDDVDKVAEIIKREFAIDDVNTADKRKELAPDSFGYMSLHHVVQLSEKRHTLTEYKRYSGMKCEIQIRTILQHAWAEIEHDLGYKSKFGITDEIKRRFSMLASLLELGDDQFMTVRDKISEYTVKATKEIKSGGEEVQINAVSVEIFVTQSPLIAQLEILIIEATDIKSSPPYKGMYEEMARSCQYCGFQSIGDVEKSLVSHKDEVEEFCKRFFLTASFKVHAVSTGFSILFFCHYFVALRGGTSEFIEYFNGLGYARHITEIFKEVVPFAQEVEKAFRKTT